MPAIQDLNEQDLNDRNANLVSYKSDRIARGALFLLMVMLCAATWEKWGSPIVDCGREMYVPAAIVQGKRLYFDLWYLFGPLIPYWHAILFRIFGIHLSVLYSAGIALVAVSTWMLYSLGRVFLPVWLSFTASFAFLLQAFQIKIFNFIIPYGYPAAYGAMFSIVLLWLLVRDCFHPRTWLIVAAGFLAGMMVLTKVEFGVPAYGVLACAIALRFLRTRSLTGLARDLALCLPGLLLCGAVYWWLVSKSSVDFIFGENLSILPNSFFITKFAKLWAEKNGFSSSPAVLPESALLGLSGAACVLAALFVASKSRLLARTVFALGVLVCGFHLALVFVEKILHHQPAELLLQVAPFFYFNSGLIWLSVVLLLVIAGGWLRNGHRPAEAALLLLAVLAFANGARVLTKFAPTGYPVFFDTLGYLAWLVALYKLSEYLPAPPPDRIWKGAAILLCSGIVALTLIDYPIFLRKFLIRSPRGSIYTLRTTGEAFTQTIDFINTLKARSERFIVMPEDTSLYFFTGTLAPIRQYIFTPQLLPPDETTRVLEELDRIPIQYVILSDRATPEYGLSRFGVDYGQEIGRWLRQKFIVVRQIGKYEQVDYPAEWGVRVYERKPVAPLSDQHDR